MANAMPADARCLVALLFASLSAAGCARNACPRQNWTCCPQAVAPCYQCVDTTSSGFEPTSSVPVVKQYTVSSDEIKDVQLDLRDLKQDSGIIKTDIGKIKANVQSLDGRVQSLESKP